MITLILAAGYATRLYPLTRDLPKALLPIGGKPILDYIADQIDTLDGVSRVIVVSNSRFAGAFEAWAATRPAGPPIAVLDDGTTGDDNKRGAVGDILYAIENANIDEDLLVLAGDNLFTFRLTDAAAFFREWGEDTILVGRLGPEEDARRFAVVEMDAAGHIIHMEEKPQNPRSNVVAYAVYFYRKDTLPMVRKYLDAGNNPDAPGHFPAWLYLHKPVRGYIFDGECIDIGTHEVYNRVKDSFGNVHDS